MAAQRRLHCLFDCMHSRDLCILKIYAGDVTGLRALLV